MTHGFLHPEAVTNDAEERQMIVIIDADYNEEIGKAHIAGIVAETIFDEKYRGDSKKPLYVTCKGIPLAEAKEMVEKMAGEYRLPYLVKYADSKARDWSI